MHEVLATRYWAIEKSFFAKMHPLVLHRLSTGRDLENLQAQKIGAYYDSDAPPPAVKVSANLMMVWDEESREYVYQIEDGRKVARIPITGTLSKTGMCSYGAVDYQRMIAKANASKSVQSILLFTDGPGGSVSGTARLGQSIAESEKPTIAFVDEMAASAHYWVASQADYIMGNAQEYTEVGSIGVLCGLLDYTQALVNDGVKYEIKRAEQSVDKARLNSYEEWPEKSLEELQSDLNMMANNFIETVGRGRGLAVTTGESGLNQIISQGENITTGKMYKMEDAMKYGMVDYVGRLEDAVHLSIDIADSRKRKSVTI